jgi:hypothetical protein
MAPKKYDLRNLPGHLARFLDTEPKTPGATDINAMNNRFYLLEALYKKDGRDKKSHPLYGVYTGLRQKYVKA